MTVRAWKTRSTRRSRETSSGQASARAPTSANRIGEEIAVVSEALMQTARYWAIEVPEQAPPPEGGVLARDPVIGQT
ncbi:MAG TPA: hypothetical protein VIT91_17545, partial [Chthoniobacterales bacterium]